MDNIYLFVIPAPTFEPPALPLSRPPALEPPVYLAIEAPGYVLSVAFSVSRVCRPGKFSLRKV